jgi:hypothetical protein
MRVARAMVSRSTPPSRSTVMRRRAAGVLHVVDLEAEVGEERVHDGAHAFYDGHGSLPPLSIVPGSLQTKGVGTAHASRSHTTSSADQV